MAPERQMFSRALDRRSFLIGSLALAGGALLAACGGDDDDDDADPTATAGAGAPTPTQAASGATPTAAQAAQTPSPSGSTGSFSSQLQLDNITPGGAMVQGGTTDIRLLNYIIAGDAGTREICLLIGDGLVNIDPDTGQASPLLATSWETSEDGLTFTFDLKEGVKFHDGEAFTSDDVKFTYEGAMNPDTTSVFAGLLNQRVASIDAPEPTTVVFNMNAVSAPFLVQNCLYSILPQHILGDVAPADWPTADFTSNPIGTGPFKFQEYRPGEGITLERNPDYHRGAPALDQYIYKVISDNTVIYQQLKTGEIDYSRLSPDFVEDAQQQSNLNVFIYDSGSATAWQLNLDPKFTTVFQDVQVRQALCYAVDRQGIIDAVRNGLSTVAVGFFAPHHWAYQPDLVPQELRYDYDPDMAMARLEEAGWIDADGDGVREKDGTKLAFTMHAHAGEKDIEGYLLVFQENWKAVGIEMTPVFEEGSLIDQRLDVTYDFQAIYTGLGHGVDPDQTIVWHSKSYKAGWNNMMYANPEVDALLDEGVRTLDVEKRKEIYADLNNLLLTDVPGFYLDFRKGVAAVSTRVKNHIPNDFQRGFNPHQWYIES